MKSLDALAFDERQCARELAELQALLAANPDLKERQDILPFFRGRPQLSAFIGSLDPYLIDLDRIAYEYDLFGDFTVDLVVGDSASKAYGFIEFEDAAPNSIFVERRGKATPEWAPRFEHGYSQIVDCFQKLDEMENCEDYEDRFGARQVKYFGLLVVGRSEPFARRELRRLEWRQERTVVNSRHVRCLTFDQLAARLARQLERYPRSAVEG